MTDTLMQAAAEVARLAGATALARWRGSLRVETKPDGSPVTDADREAETAARAWIAKRFPADGIAGEEFDDRPGTSGRRWLLDPVDGTRAFVRGVPLWGSLVAVVEGTSVLAGAADFPAVGESIVAAPGGGCWHGGRRASVSQVAGLPDATILTSSVGGAVDPDRLRAFHRLAGSAGDARTWSDCYGYLLVATGRAEAMLDPRLSAWDSAVMLPIIQEAGGVFTDWSGSVTGFGESAVATNAALAAEIRRIIAAEDAP